MLDRVDVRRLVTELEDGVMCDGFDGYFCNTASDPAEVMLALEAIGAEQTSQILRSACSHFPGGMPSSNRELRQKQLLEVASPDSNVFEREDDRFFEYPEELQKLLATYEVSPPPGEVSSKTLSFDRAIRQVEAIGSVLLCVAAIYAVMQFIDGQGGGWLLAVLSSTALAALLAAHFWDAPAIFGLTIGLGLATAALGLAGLSGLVLLEGGLVGGLWQDTAIGAAAIVLAAYRLLRAWRAARTRI